MDSDFRATAARAALRIATAVVVVAGASFPVVAGESPQGDTAAAWPAAWNTYRMADGNAVRDVVDDENPDDADLASGPCTGTGCAGTLPTVYYASDGTNAFFRMRLAVNPYDATKGGLVGNAYLAQLAVGGIVRAVVGVDGKSASVDYVYTATAPGTTVTPIYTWPFTAPSAGMRVVPDGTGQYFVDFQVPVARITTASGGTITATTPVQLFYGSSAAANLATINKDFMTGSSVSFTNVSTVSLSPASLTAASSAVATGGPNPPAVGEATTYTVTLTIANPGGGDLTGATATATLPAGVTYVSGPVSVSGSTITWNAGTLLPGATRTVEVVVSLTPTAAGSTPLLSALDASGTDAATATPRAASAPPLSVTAIENAAPAAGDDTLTVAEDGSAAVNVLANDTDDDGDALSVGGLSDPAHGTVTESGGVVTYEPDPNYAGPDSFTDEVCDTNGACDTATVTVTVTPVNDAPSDPAGASFATPEDTPYSGTLPGSVDPDGDPLTYDATTGPEHGDLTVNPDGSYTYTPDPGWSGGDSFGYEACDPSGACATGTVTVTVTPVNDPPPAPPGDAFSTPEDTPHSGTLPGSVDPDGDPLTFGATTAPAHGELTVNPDGSYTYTPDDDYTGADSFGYEVCDPAGACAAAVVTVTVTPVNDPPAGAVDDAVTTPEDTPYDGTLPAVTDPDGDPLAYELTTEPAHGDVTVGEDGTYTYTPDPGYAGSDSFGYEACDPSGACAAATVTVTVTAVNDAPVAGDDTVSTAFDTAVTFDPTTNDSDPDGDALTVTVSDPAHGTVTVTGTTVTYTPDPGWSGDDSFTYLLCDPTPACDTATITVTVAGTLGANLPPVADAGDDRTVASGTPVTLDGTGSFDPDLDPLSWTWVQTSGPAVPLTGAGTAMPSFAGVTGPATLTFELTVSDGVLTDTATVTIVVAAAGAVPPECDPVSVETGGAVTIALPCTNDDGATAEVVDDAGHGTVTVDGSGEVVYTPDDGYTGADTFTVRVCTAAGCAESVVTVTVTGDAGAVPGQGSPLLPRTGTPTDVLVALAFVAVVAGFAMQRRPAVR